MTGPSVVLTLAGIFIVWIAVRSWQGRLSRNYFAGVRTPSTMRSDEAFRAANKVAAPFMAAAGILMAATGVLAAILQRRDVGVLISAGLGLAIVVILVGAALGVRAARSAP